MNKQEPFHLLDILNQAPIIPSITLDAQLLSEVRNELTSQAGEKIIAQEIINISNNRIRPYPQIKESLDQFLNKLPNNRWFLMPGLRGIGKTTILKQLYHDTSLTTGDKFYLSFDQVKILNSRYQMRDIILALEESLQSKLEDYPHHLILLFDEVQYISDWALGLKTIFDRCRRVFILATGSSALALQENPDVARRVDIVKVYPLSLPDVINFKRTYARQQTPLLARDLAQDLRQTIFKSADIQALATGLKRLRPSVNCYWQNLDRSRLLNQYRQYDSLPYTLTAASELEKSKRVNQALNTIILKDIAGDSRLSGRVLATMPKLMEILAHAERKGLASIANTLEVSLDTVRNMIDQLEKTSLLEPIRPWGAKTGHLTKPYRYLFASPALRLALVNSAGQISLDTSLRDRIRGLLWEDAVGLYLRRILETERAVVEYDTAPGAADFIISWGGNQLPIVIEIGSRKTSSKQIIYTKRLTKFRYGLVITESELRIDKGNKIVFLPFSFFFLI